MYASSVRCSAAVIIAVSWLASTVGCGPTERVPAVAQDITPPVAATLPGDEPEVEPAPVSPQVACVMPTYVYASGYDPSIRVAAFDDRTGALTPIGGPVPTLANPSFLALHPDGSLFAAHEIGRFEGKPSGAVSSFAIGDDGGLRPVGQRASIGRGPAHLSLDRTGRWLFVASYTDGVVSVFPRHDGVLSEPVATVEHGEGAATHMVVAAPDNRWVVVVNRKRDTVVAYRFDAATGSLAKPGTVLSTAAGQGPRHVDFHPTLPVAYVIFEDANEIGVYDLSAADGTLTAKQRVGTRAQRVTTSDASADIHVHPNGRFVYGSVRGGDTIVGYAVDPQTGQLRRVANVDAGGKTPRNFEIHPDGRWMLVAHQGSNSVQTFALDPQTGQVRPTEHRLAAPKPTFVGIVRPRTRCPE